MRNPDLPKLLRAAKGYNDGFNKQEIEQLEQAAIELEKLEKIYKLVEDTPAYRFATNGGQLMATFIEILHEAP